MHQILISFPFLSFSYHDTHYCLYLFTQSPDRYSLSECKRPTFDNTVCSFVLSRLLHLVWNMTPSPLNDRSLLSVSESIK